VSQGPAGWARWETAWSAGDDRCRLVVSGHDGCPVLESWLANVARNRLAAGLLGTAVVPVLVDRWRWPAVDALALDAAVRGGGRAGWPLLSTWLPDGRPAAATSDLPDGPSDLVALAQSIDAAWRSDRPSFERAAEALVDEGGAVPSDGPRLSAEAAVSVAVASLGLADLGGHPHLPALSFLCAAAETGRSDAAERLDTALDALVASLCRPDGTVLRCAEGPGFERPRADPATWTAAGLLPLLAARPTPARIAAARRAGAWLLSRRRGTAWGRPGCDAPNTLLTAWNATGLATAGATLGATAWVDAAAEALERYRALARPAEREEGVPGTLADTAALAVAALALDEAGRTGWRDVASRAAAVAHAAFVVDGVPRMTAPPSRWPWHRPDLLDDELPSGAACLARATEALGAVWEPGPVVRAAMGQWPVGTAGLWEVALRRRRQ
jgi:uncharacterized protein YyaL (SSP411 family)